MSTEPAKLTGTSLDISAENRTQLKQLFPTVFTETKNDKGELVELIDFEKLKAEQEAKRKQTAGQTADKVVEVPFSPQIQQPTMSAPPPTPQPTAEKTVEKVIYSEVAGGGCVY